MTTESSGVADTLDVGGSGVADTRSGSLLLMFGIGQGCSEPRLPAWAVRAERLVGDVDGGVDFTILALREWSEVALSRRKMAFHSGISPNLNWDAILRS